MRAVAALLFLVIPAFAGCLGAEGSPQPADDCRSCSHELDPDGDGKIALGTFTWGEPSRAGASTRVSEPVASFNVPTEVKQIEVSAVRHHEGLEQESARLVLRSGGNERGAFTFEAVTLGSGDDRERLVLKGTPALHVYGHTLHYTYQSQQDGVKHKLELEVVGYL